MTHARTAFVLRSVSAKASCIFVPLRVSMEMGQNGSKWVKTRDASVSPHRGFRPTF